MLMMVNLIQLSILIQLRWILSWIRILDTSAELVMSTQLPNCVDKRLVKYLPISVPALLLSRPSKARHETSYDSAKLSHADHMTNFIALPSFAGY
jgi:hypothetical protein